MEMESLQDLYLDELKDSYSAENQLVGRSTSPKSRAR